LGRRRCRVGASGAAGLGTSRCRAPYPSDRGRVAPSLQAKGGDRPSRGSCSRAFPLPVRPQADPGRGAWPMRPAGRPLRPYPGGVTPSRDGQARILRGRLVPRAGRLWLYCPGGLDGRERRFRPRPCRRRRTTGDAGGRWRVGVDDSEQRRGGRLALLVCAGRADRSVTNRRPPEGG
jgi:hypothetical protein